LGSEELDADAQYKKLYSWRRWYTGFFQGTTLLAVPLKSDHSARHPISVRLAFLREKDNEDKPTDKWDEHQKLPPPAAIRIVQSACTDGQGRQDGDNTEDGADRIAEQCEDGRCKYAEQEEPPVLGALGATIESRVFLEAGGDSV
jgi:hypothetical protein